MFKKTLLSVAVLGLVSLSASTSYGQMRDAGSKARGDMFFWGPSTRVTRVYRAPVATMPAQAAAPVERRFSAEPANPSPAPAPAAVADANAPRVVRTYSAEPTTVVRARNNRNTTPLYLRSKGDPTRFDSH